MFPHGLQADRSLIGMLMLSTSKTDALAGATVLFEVGSWFSNRHVDVKHFEN
jgi:hypothetical protein